jgi:hypothetical protein
MIQDKVYRTIPTSCFDFDERARNMAQTGVTRQVVSPMPELLSYWLSPADGAQLVQRYSAREMTFVNHERCEIGRVEFIAVDQDTIAPRRSLSLHGMSE